MTTNTAAISPEFKAAVQAVQEADMLMNSEYEPLNVHLNKENTVNAPLSVRSSLGSPSTSRWVDRMVKVANACNTLVVKNCNLCHVYANRQVEFEREGAPAMRSYTPAFTPGAVSNVATSVLLGGQSPTERAWHKSCAGAAQMNSMEVNLYRQFLFDEESVVDMLDAAYEKVDEEEGEDADGSIINARTAQEEDGKQPPEAGELHCA